MKKFYIRKTFCINKAVFLLEEQVFSMSDSEVEKLYSFIQSIGDTNLLDQYYINNFESYYGSTFEDAKETKKRAQQITHNVFAGKKINLEKNELTNPGSTYYLGNKKHMYIIIMSYLNAELEKSMNDFSIKDLVAPIVEQQGYKLDMSDVQEYGWEEGAVIAVNVIYEDYLELFKYTEADWRLKTVLPLSYHSLWNMLKKNKSNLLNWFEKTFS